MEIAIRELQYTVNQARAYLMIEGNIADVLRSHALDLQEDISTLEKYKSSYGDKSQEILELVADAKRVKRSAEKEAFAIETASKRALAAQQQLQPAEPTVQSGKQQTGIKLPRIKLPTFDGESSDHFRGFIEAFHETVKTEPDLSNIRKWLLLKGQLTGRALQMVKELPLVPETYEAGMKILENAFGSSRRSILKMYQRLQLLPNAEMETESLRMTHAKLEGILLSLSTLKVKANEDDFLRAVVLSKFPHDLLHTLKVSDSMTLEEFRISLNSYIQSRDCVIQQVFTVSATTNASNQRSTQPTSTVTQYQQSATNGSKGGASGFKDRPRHYKNAVSTNGGDIQKNAPPPQVTDPISLKSNAKKERQRLHKCIFCQGEHWSDECETIKSLDERKKIVAERCQKCLRPAHTGTECSNKWNGCVYCKEMTHNRAICPKTFGPTGKILLSKAEETRSKESVSCTKFITAMLPVGNTSKKRKASIRAIFDTAGGQSLITQKLAKQLQLEATANPRIKLVGMDDAPLADNVEARKLLLFPPRTKPIQILVYVVPTIVDEVTATDVAEFKCRYPAYADLTMPEEGNGSQIDLLLGYEAMTQIITLQSSKNVGELQLLSTIFGWVPFGSLPENNYKAEAAESKICLMKQADPIKLMCDLDIVGLTDIVRTDTEEEVITLDKFYQTIQKIGKNYQINWPYRIDPPDLDDNFGLAFGRLVSLHKQLVAAPEMLKAYDQIIQKQIEEDIVETVNTRNKPPRGKVHYLPHRGIIRFGKSTPLRMVFDAAAKARKNAKSLNDNIYKGGNWVTNLPGVLLRFRRYNLAVTADISKAFHQIFIAPEDRDVVRFLWLRNINKPPTQDNIVVLRFKRMAFGIVASPFLLTATIKYHIRQTNTSFAEIIERDLYADNLVTSIPQTIHPTHFYNEIKKCFEDMGMKMTQWSTENQEFREIFYEEDRTEEPQQSALGITWDINTRLLSIKQPNFSKTENKPTTKRTALQEMAAIYDPLGWMLPIIVKARIFIRKIWQENYDWDTPLTQNMQEEWINIKNQLHRANEIILPRPYAESGLDDIKHAELHAFCDASIDAYGVAVYLRVKKPTGYWTGLVAAKARLAPKTQLSIPRLELLAAIIASKFLIYVEKELELEIPIIKYLWGDSKCVIAWMSTNKVLPAFIEKAAKNFKLLNIQHFFYVPTSTNPADVVSQGATIEDLQTQCWWTGPKWLKNKADWPTQHKTCEQTELLIEKTSIQLYNEEKLLLVSSVKLKNTIPQDNTNSPFQLDPEEFSTTSQLYRRTAFCLKAATRFLRGRGTIDTNDLNYFQAEVLWLRWEQQRIYEPVNKETNISYLRNLKIEIDENGIIRCITRMKWAQLSRDETEPILLAKKTSLTKLIILTTHFQNHHAGTAHTLATLRRRYWLPHGRREVYQTIKTHCHTCRRYDAQPFKMPEMAALPPFRINKTDRPFKNTGLDVFGPFKVKQFNEQTPTIKKRWVVIFTCLVIRAVHLEILKDMTADEFLSSFRRFVGRRGVPQIIVSDNAPQFKVVEGIFQCVWRRFAQADVTTKYYAEHNITWKFIPANAPWMGGAYERMIKTIKSSYERVYGGKILKEDQFELALIEVEAVVNSRPISYVDREKDTEIVSPNDFLCVRYPSIPVNFERAPTNSLIAEAWKASEKYLDEFWRVWSEQYLRAIRERRDSMRNPRKAEPQPPQPGELVLMVDPDAKRSSWRVAVVERTIPSEDRRIRAVQIRAANRARMIRPISQLASLKLIMELPADLPELTEDHSALVVADHEGTVAV